MKKPRLLLSIGVSFLVAYGAAFAQDQDDIKIAEIQGEVQSTIAAEIQNDAQYTASEFQADDKKLSSEIQGEVQILAIEETQEDTSEPRDDDQGSISEVSDVQGSVAQGQWKYYSVLGATLIEMTALSGDPDLYVRAGSRPTLTVWNCRPFTSASLERCPNLNPTITYYIGVYGYTAATYSLHAENQNTTTPTLTVGQAVNGSVPQGQWDYFKVTGAQLVDLYNLSADLDLYVKAGSKPTFSSYNCRPYKGGTTSERCIGMNPATTYYVGIYGYRSGSYRILASGSSGGSTPTLTVGQAVNGSVNQGQWDYFIVTGAQLVDLYNLSADLDLYVRAGSKPTLTSYHCRPYSSGTSTERCIGMNPATTYYVGVYGYRSGSYRLLASASGGGSTPTLTVGQAVNGSVPQGQWDYFMVTGAQLVDLYNLSADLDLYVRAGSKPTLTSYHCRPYKGGTTSERCIGMNPATTYYVGIYGYQSGSYRILASGSGGGSTPTLTVGHAVNGSVPQGQWDYFLATGAQLVTLYNLSADLDLYVRAGSKPTLTSYHCRPYKGGTTSERCIGMNPATTYYVGIYGYRSGSYRILTQ